MKRKLVAIMAADVVGYSKLMERDEEATISSLHEMLELVVEPAVSQFTGNIVKLMGDGVLAQFASALDAVKSAIHIQKDMLERGGELQLRIGLHVGDVVITGDDILGDSVNIAARLESLAKAGGIIVSQQVHDHIANHDVAIMQSLGPQQVKNIVRPINAFELILPNEPSKPATQMAFDDFVVDLTNFQLTKGENPVHTEPLVFDLLSFIVLNSEKVVSRDDLIESVWGGRIVSDTTIASCIKTARKALGDDGKTQKYIRTIRGRGIQFVGKLAVLSSPQNSHGSVIGIQTQTDLQPTLAILPFRAPQHRDELVELVDGLVENLSTILTRIPLLSILSRSSAQSIDRQSVDIREIGKKLGAQYVLEGSVQTSGKSLRVNVQLVETIDGTEIWARRFERVQSDENLDELLEGFLLDILQRLEPRLTQSMLSKLQGPDNARTAAQLLIKAVGLLSIKGWHRKTFEEAAEILRKSISLDPARPLAHAHLAIILALGHRVGSLPRSPEVVKEVVAEAEIALEQNSEDSTVVGLAGCALADIGQGMRAVPLLKKAIELNPDNPHAWAALGSTYALLRRSDEAVEPLEKGIKNAPLDTRLAVWGAVLTMVHLLNGDTQLAQTVAEQACQSDDKNHLPRLALTAVFLVQGNSKAAVLACRETLRTKPDLTQLEIECFVGRKLGAGVEQLRQSILTA